MYVSYWMWHQLLSRSRPEAILKLTGSCLPRFVVASFYVRDLMWGSMRIGQHAARGDGARHSSSQWACCHGAPLVVSHLMLLLTYARIAYAVVYWHMYMCGPAKGYVMRLDVRSRSDGLCTAQGVGVVQRATGGLYRRGPHWCELHLLMLPVYACCYYTRWASWYGWGVL